MLIMSGTSQAHPGPLAHTLSDKAEEMIRECPDLIEENPRDFVPEKSSFPLSSPVLQHFSGFFVFYF